MSPAAMVIDPAAEATVCAMFASRGVNGRSGLSAAKTPMLIAAESTLPPCAHPAFSPKLTFMALTMNPTTTPVTTARALRGSASRDDIATTRGAPGGRAATSARPRENACRENACRLGQNRRRGFHGAPNAVHRVSPRDGAGRAGKSSLSTHSRPRVR